MTISGTAPLLIAASQLWPESSESSNFRQRIDPIRRVLRRMKENLDFGHVSVFIAGLRRQKHVGNNIVVRFIPAEHETHGFSKRADAIDLRGTDCLRSAVVIIAKINGVEIVNTQWRRACRPAPIYRDSIWKGVRI